MSTDAAPRVSVAMALLGVAMVLALAYVLRGILVAFFTAALLIALIDGLVNVLAQHWPSGPRWALSTIAGFIIIALIAVCALTLSVGIAQIAADAPTIIGRLDALAGNISASFGLPAPHLSSIASPERVMSALAPVFTGIGDLFAGATFTALFLGFMLASRPLLLKKFALVAKTPERAQNLDRVLQKIARGAGDYMWVQTVTGAIYAGASGVVLALIGLDNVLFWTVLIFLLSYIPVLGVAIASLGPALFALVQFPTYWQALAAFAAVQVFASLVGNVLLPKMQADKQNLDPTVSIFSVALWTLLWGIPGAFLAIPLTVMLMIIFNQFEQTRWAAILISNDGEPEA